MPPKKGLPFLSAADEKRLATRVRQGGTFCVEWPPFPGLAAAALALATSPSTPVIVVTDGPVTMDRLISDLESLAEAHKIDSRPLPFPPLESFAGHGAPPHPQLTGDRLRALRALQSTESPPLLVTCIQALKQKTVTPEWVARQSRTLSSGMELDPATLLPWLEDAGYQFEPEVLSPGQAAWRGGILDVWPPGQDWPLRVEFFGSVIESLRWFDPVEQRSRAMESAVELSPAGEGGSGALAKASLIEHVGKGARWLWADRESIRAHGELLEESAREAGAEAQIVTSGEWDDAMAAARPGLQLWFSLSPGPDDQAEPLDWQPIAGLPGTAGGALPLDRLEEQRRRFVGEWLARAADGWSLHLFFSTPGGMERFTEAYARDLPAEADVRFHHGMLSESFFCAPRSTAWIGDLDLYGIRRDQPNRYDRAARASRARAQSGERIQSWTDLQPGDYVVHIDHGIGIYRGLFEIDVSGGKQEALTLEYAEGAKIYLPVAQTHLLSRYIGVGKRRPDLHAIGGKRWLREKASAERAVEDMAAMLLETQAARDAQPGHAFGPDTSWQHEFEATFPFAETPDQAEAIRAVKADMENARPMDRLICGDVGYGKTEVAMRASFKAVMDGKQVAILVPTTVLAQQHVDSFTERMAAFPVRIEALSRFQTAAEQQDILRRLAEGTVDIVIGTHRLVQADVRFRDLGLVIIDEEQRFGVKHKEHLKRLRRLVDVLTMTATPIPRTLYMSLTGAKDLSIIETAPVERLPIETIVTEHRDDIVREAILRELNREGQVFFLHNRVGTIHALHVKLAALVPEARIRVAHGQMNERELSAVMRAFGRGEFDVLLCTTIIESGLNIPNVNTIIIDRADRFGLSELYQLRGRVGRYKRKAYAYLLLPRHGRLFFMARQRIGAIKRYSSLGSGFKLAMRDLELRGAGNILGAEQSGHIAAVGFDLYCQLLQRTVARLKGEAPEPIIEVELDLDFVALSPEARDASRSAVIPIGYVDDETMRVRLYRRLAAITRPEQVEALVLDLRDRFGPVPEPLTRLLLLSRIKLAATRQRINRIEVNEDKVIMTRGKDFITDARGRFPRLADGDTSTRLRGLLALVEGAPAPAPPEPKRPKRRGVGISV